MNEMDKIASSADRHPAVVQGQENLEGVKSVQIKRNLKKNSESEYVVTQSVRTEMLYDTIESAKSAYKDIHDAKEEAYFEESEKEKEESVKAPAIESETKDDDESETHESSTEASFAEQLLKQAAVPENFEYNQISGDPRLFKQLNKHAPHEPMGLLSQKVEEAESDVNAIASRVSDGVEIAEDAELNNLYEHAEACIQDCKKLIGKYQYFPKYKPQCDEFYDYVVELENKLNTYKTNTDEGLDSAREFHTEYEQNKRQYKLPFMGDINSTNGFNSDEYIHSVADAAGLGFENVTLDKNPDQVAFGNNAQNPEGLEAYTKNNGYGVLPEHIDTNKLYAIDNKEVQAAEQQYSQLQPNFPVSNMEHELTLGVNRELEHVSDPAKALEIAIDHLAENENYYTLLNKVMPEFGPEEKPKRNVEVSENPSGNELADKHNYTKSYQDYMDGLLNNDK